jgi:hypothetical protein
MRRSLLTTPGRVLAVALLLLASFAPAASFRPEVALAQTCGEVAPSQQKACPLPWEGTFTGFIRDARGMYVYRLEADEPGLRLHLELTNLPADYDLYVVSGEGEVLAASVQRGTASEHLVMTLPDAGSYFVYVAVSQNRPVVPDQPFTLSVALRPPSDEDAAPVDALPVDDAALAEPVDFSGQTVRLVLSAEAGGATDATARLLAPILADLLPGQPAVQVENQPGVSNMQAAREVLTAPPVADEVSVVVYNPFSAATSGLYLMGNGSSPGLQGFNPAKQAVYLGQVDALPPTPSLCARTDRVKDLDDLLGRTRPLLVGVAGGYDTALVRWSIDVGFPLRWLGGYPNLRFLTMGFNEGEVDAIATCRQSDLDRNPSWLANDEITPLFYWNEPAAQLQAAQAAGRYPWYRHVAVVKALTPDQQTVLDVLNAVGTGSAVYAVSSQTPPAVAHALQIAFQQAVANEVFGQGMQAEQLPVAFEGPEALQATDQALAALSPEARTLLRQALGLVY